jgi:hypothetical protein
MERGPQRMHWLVVHRGPRITVASLIKGGVRADGCHSTVNELNVITYIHLQGRCRQSVLSKYLNQSFNSTFTRVIDTASDKILTHTSEFELLVANLNNQDPNFVSDGCSLGLLSRHIKSTGCSVALKQTPLEIENTELRQRVSRYESDHAHMERRLHASTLDCVRASEEILFLRGAISKLNESRAGDESEMKRLRIENKEFRRLGATDMEVRRMNREVLTLKDNLDDKTRDCKLLSMTLRIAREDNAALHAAASMAPRPSNYMGT